MEGGRGGERRGRRRKLQQEEHHVGCEKAITMWKKEWNRWQQHHPGFNSRGSYYQLSREGQVIMV